jgi:DNA-binding response OmpR family regulator
MIMLQGARILIVDDERSTRLSLSEIFSLRGAETNTAATGVEAIVKIQQQEFDLIILDIKMPGMSGLEVLDQVRQLSPGTVCILLTAHATIDSAIVALRQGAFDYILKPAQPKTILEVAERALGKRQENLRRQNLVELIEQTVEAFKGNPAASLPAGTSGISNLSAASTVSRNNPPILRAGDLSADVQRREAKLDDRLLDLTPTEFDTLAFLIKNAERVVSCRDLVKAVHGYETSEQAARPIMRVHIHRLRQKIETDATKPLRLLTIRSAGYMLTNQPRPQ